MESLRREDSGRSRQLGENLGVAMISILFGIGTAASGGSRSAKQFDRI
jgi:hypothetical protein